jgi:hypothetical protein
MNHPNNHLNITYTANPQTRFAHHPLNQRSLAVICENHPIRMNHPNHHLNTTYTETHKQDLHIIP